MTPSNALLNKLVTLLADDPTGLGDPANPSKVHLAKAAFSPGPSLTPASFTEADFDGYAEIDAGLGNQQVFTDPTTGQRIIQLLEPAGGWSWLVTGATSLPMTIYGDYTTDDAGTTLWGCNRWTTAVVLTASGQGVNIAFLRFAVNPAALQ